MENTVRNLRMRPTLAALGATAALLLATGCEGDGTTTGGTSGTNGGTNGGATWVEPSSIEPKIFAVPTNCYKGGTATFNITGGASFGKYPVQLRLTDGGPTKKSWTKTTDENGDASWELKCDSMPSDEYEVVMTWPDENNHDQHSKAFLDILRKD
jgi:hypothetical protein